MSLALPSCILAHICYVGDLASGDRAPGVRVIENMYTSGYMIARVTQSMPHGRVQIYVCTRARMCRCSHNTNQCFEAFIDLCLCASQNVWMLAQYESVL